MKLNLKNEKRLTIIFLLFVFLSGCNTSGNLPYKVTKADSDSVFVTHIVSDTLFNSKQSIYILAFDDNYFNNHRIAVGYSGAHLERTSRMAERAHAIAAINGSFFDEDKGGGVTYVERNDSVLSHSQATNHKWAKPDSLINGVLILTKQNRLKILPAKPEQYYATSKEEKLAIVSGPLLLRHSIAQKLPNMSFSYKRHPRTCLCKTNNAVLFIAIDGRTKNAAGMTLPEVQTFLKRLGCIDAINLDGGGSTTMWTREKGVVNHPSDKEGERPVANAILILKK